MTSIRSRVLILALLPASTIAILLCIYFVTTQMEALEETLIERGLATARHLAPACEYGVFSGNQEILKALTDAVHREDDVLQVGVLSLEGLELARSGEGEASAALAIKDKEPTSFFIPIHHKQRFYFYAPIMQSAIQLNEWSDDMGELSLEEQHLGWVLVALSMESTVVRQFSAALRGMLITVLGLLVTALIAWKMGRSVSDPIYNLTRAVHKLEQGYMETTVNVDTIRELATLERGLNRMSSALREAQRNLQHQVDARTSELQERNEELERMDNIVKSLNQEVDLAHVLQSVLEHGLVLLPHADKGSFLLYNEAKGYFEVVVSVGYEPQQIERLRFTRDEAFARYSAEDEQVENDVFIIRNTGLDSRLTQLPMLPLPMAMLTMAVSLNGERQGFLIFDNMSDPEAFDHSDIRKLDRFREHAVCAVAKAQLLKEIREKNDEILATQHQLSVQEKMASLGTLTAGIAHEIKNPLNFVNNFSKLSVELGADLSQMFEEHRNRFDEDFLEEVRFMLGSMIGNAERIHEHGSRANKIINGMMMLSGNVNAKRERIDINSLVTRYTELAFDSWRMKEQPLSVAVTRRLNAEDAKLMVVPQNLGRVFLNIADNACYAMAKKARLAEEAYHPEIQITTRTIGDQVEVRIRDNGPGISQEALSQIFNPFFTTKSAGEGNIGLGLSISYEIVVHDHKGDMRVETEEGRYTEFILLLPGLGEKHDTET